jgi:hypothetical protein
MGYRSFADDRDERLAMYRRREALGMAITLEALHQDARGQMTRTVVLDYAQRIGPFYITRNGQVLPRRLWED